MTDRRKTLREVCAMLGIPRRAIQGYEKIGMIRPSGRNERGYLLYDEETCQRIQQIRQYQRFGFQVREIKILLSLPKAGLREALIARREVLIQNRIELSADIDRITVMIEELQ